MEKEKTHRQWDQHGKCFILLFSMVIVTLMRGSKNMKSIIGIERCSGEDWALLVCYMVVCGIILAFSLKHVIWEQNLKMKVGFGMAKSDITFQ